MYSLFFVFVINSAYSKYIAIVRLSWVVMSLFQNILIIWALIAASAFFSCAEIALASSRKIRLQQMSENGDNNAQKVLELQQQPGNFFTVIQVALNAIAIMGGILGE